MRRGWAALALLLVAGLGGIEVADRLRVPAATGPITLDARPLSVAVDARSRRVFILDDKDRIDVVDADSGALLRATPLGLRPSGLLVDEAGNRVLAPGAWGGPIGVLDARSGALLRLTSPGIRPLVVAADPRTDRLFVAGTDHGSDAARVFDIRSGALVRAIGHLDPPITPRPLPDDDASAIGPIGVSERTGRVLIVGTHVTVLDARTGAVVGTAPGQPAWSAPWAPEPWAIAVDDAPRSGGPGGHVFIGDSEEISLFDGASGRLLRTIPVGSAYKGMVADERTGRVFVVRADDSGVSVLDGASGRLLRTTPVGMLTDGIALDARRGRLFVSTVAGVRVLDARTGGLVRTLRVNGTPDALAVDEQSGRVYAVVAPMPGSTAPLSPLDAFLARLRHWLPWLARPAIPSGTTTVVDVLDPAG